MPVAFLRKITLAGLIAVASVAAVQMPSAFMGQLTTQEAPRIASQVPQEKGTIVDALPVAAQTRIAFVPLSDPDNVESVTPRQINTATLLSAVQSRAAKRRAANANEGTDAPNTRSPFSSFLALLGAGIDGQVLTLTNGVPSWKDAPSTTLRPAASERPASSGGQSPQRRGGGGTPPPDTTLTDGNLEAHSHQNAAAGGQLDINAATTGILAASRGGTAFSSYSTGDLLVGADGALAKLAIGTAQQVLVSSGGTLAWSSTVEGNLTQGVADSRYVNVTGDTMTGSLNILNGKNLQVAGTITGSILKAVASLSTSGTLVFEGSASGSSLYLATSLQGVGLTDCDAATSTLAWDANTGRFSCGTDADTTVTAGQGLSLTSTSLKVSDSLSGSLLRFLTISGSNLYARNQLSSSGTLVTESGAYFGGTTMVVQAGSNRVGIGTESPDTALEAIGTISGSLITQNGAGSNYFMGNVGIGKTSPATKLDVVGTISGSALVIGNGTAAAPSLSFNGDADSGIYHLASDKIGIITGGSATKGITIDGNGYVGIGLTSPVYPLNVRSDGGFSASIDGRVGIGVGAALAVRALDIRESVATAVSSTTFWNSTFGGVLITNSNATANTVAGIGLQAGAGGASGIGAIQESSSLNALAFFTGGQGVSSTVPERMRIDSAGNVGVGTTTPSSFKLQVAGNIGPNADNATDLGATGTRFANIYSVTSKADIFNAQNGLKIQDVYFIGTSVADGIQYNSGNGRYDFYTNSVSRGYMDQGQIYFTPDLFTVTTTNGGHIVLQPAGNVGIGTTSPDSKLDVVGTISGALITQNGAGTNYLLGGKLGIGTASPANFGSNYFYCPILCNRF